MVASSPPDLDAGRLFGIDLHAHSTASDGLLSPTDLVHEAIAKGVSVLALTDHDTLDGLAEAEAAATAHGVTLVRGVELSTTIPGPEIHILGYGVGRDDPDLLAKLDNLARDRVRRISRVVKQLNVAGYSIDLDAILAQATEGSVGRPHVARALIEIGAATDMSDAFARFLRRGTVGWAKRAPFTAEEAVGLLASHGAIPVLAHPLSTNDATGTVARLVPAGLRGLEVFYGEYTDSQHHDLLAIANGAGLLPTGGSDYHGPRFREGRDLGAVPVPGWVWDGLREAMVQAA